MIRPESPKKSLLYSKWSPEFISGVHADEAKISHFVMVLTKGRDLFPGRWKLSKRAMLPGADVSLPKHILFAMDLIKSYNSKS